MYLAKMIENGEISYFIRESYLDGNRWRSRDLVALGTDPSCWIHYPGGNAYYIDERIEDELRAMSVHVTQEDLERVFWPFFRPSVQRTIRRFTSRRTKDQTGRVDRKEMFEQQKEIPLFDKRRLFFLRYGATDPRRIALRPLMAYNRLLQKSRDEIEQMFAEMEAELRPGERRMYVYFAFDLQRFFSGPLASRYPQALDPDKLDEAFLHEVCRLQEAPELFGEDASRGRLDPALVRYVIMYFDNEFQAPHPAWDYVEDFRRRHRDYRRPESRPRLSVGEACRLLDIRPEHLPEMSLKDLARQYREKALECHPDRGGSHEGFIRLSRAYRDLLARKASRVPPP